MTRDCQCRMRLVGGSAGTFTQPRHQSDAERLEQRFRDYAGDEDWRLREWVAAFGWRLSGDHGEFLAAGLLADPHPNVRRAANESIGYRIDDPAAWLDMRRHPQEWFTAPTPPTDDVSQYPYAARSEAARGDGPVPAALLDDPLCEIRGLAVRHVPTAAVQAVAQAALWRDACEHVRIVAIERFGPAPDVEIATLTDDEATAVAKVTQSPGHLMELAEHRGLLVRIAVAANSGCPREVLVMLSTSENQLVSSTAFGNPSWPEDLPIPAPYAGREDELPRDPGPLASAVLGTRTRVRCAAGRSKTFNPSGWFHPPPDAVGICDADAVILHSWGPFCLAHQAEVDGSRQHSGADGFLGERLRSGVWVWLNQGGPYRSATELWQGSSDLEGQPGGAR